VSEPRELPSTLLKENLVLPICLENVIAGTSLHAYLFDQGT